MSICGPYIIQYSSLMSSLFLKGYFTKENWVELSLRRKIQAVFMMTFVGLVFIVPLLDVCLKIQAMVILIFIPFVCMINETSIS